MRYEEPEMVVTIIACDDIVVTSSASPDTDVDGNQ